jgi:ABC-type transport system involved in multi-copper enzyme maturation permease subunit
VNILKIAGITFMEARWRKIAWAVVLLGLAFLAIFGTGFYFMWRDIGRFNDIASVRALEPVNFFILVGFYGIAFLAVALALLISVDTVAGEITSGTIQTLVTKPLRRWEVIVGKWLGLGLMLSAFTVVMAAALIGIVYGITRYLPPNPAPAITLIVLEGMVVLTLSILGGTRLPALANGVVIFMLYGLAFIAGWIEQIGAMLRNEAAINTGIVVSLIMPSEAMWKRAAYLLQPPMLRELGLDFTAFGAASTPSPLMVGYTVVYIVALLLLAIHLFNTRDL